MNVTQKQHIAIVGGGMVGATLALLLSQQLGLEKNTANPVTISLLEQFAPRTDNDLSSLRPSFDERSTALSAGSVELLQTLQCWQPLLENAQPISAVHVSDRGHFGGTRLTADDYALDALGYVIENRRLGQVLWQQLHNSPVECLAPAVVTACQPRPQGYQLQIEQGGNTRNLDVDLLIIADGVASPLRQALGIDTQVTDYKQVALIANVALDRPHQGIAYERFTDEGPLALLPLPAVDGVQRASLVWTLPQARQQDVAEWDKATLMAALQERFGYRAGNIVDIGECHWYPLQLVEAREQIRSHVVVAGNAAHLLHPVAGQGFNLALRDCKQLCAVLARAQKQNQSFGALATLQQYLSKQEQDQQLTIQLTDRLVKLFSSSRLPLALLRQLGFASLNILPLAKQQFAQRMMGL